MEKVIESLHAFKNGGFNFSERKFQTDTYNRKVKIVSEKLGNIWGGFINVESDRLDLLVVAIKTEDVLTVFDWYTKELLFVVQPLINLDY